MIHTKRRHTDTEFNSLYVQCKHLIKLNKYWTDNNCVCITQSWGLAGVQVIPDSCAMHCSISIRTETGPAFILFFERSSQFQQNAIADYVYTTLHTQCAALQTK